MKILWILGELPLPPDAGGKMRVWGLFKELAPRHDVTAVVLDPGPEAHDRLSQLKECCHRVETLPWQGRPSKLGMLFGAAKTAAAKFPYGVIKYCTSETEQALSKLAAGDFDIIQCENIGFHRYLSAPKNAPTIMNTQNVEARIWQQRTGLAKNSLMQAYIRSQAGKMAAYEKWLLRQYDLTIAVSEDDKKIMQCEYGVERIEIVPNAVDISHFQPSKQAPEPDLVVFTGAMDYAPNDDAMKYFMQDIWPQILQRRPAARLIIAGRQPSASLYTLAEKTPQVEITGWVPETHPYLARASVIVVPLRMGSGSRLKILEAMAMQKPIISTTIGAEGIAAIPGQHLLIADSPQEFTDTTLSLLTNPESSQKISTNARHLVETHYSWQSCANHLESIWQAAHK